MSRELSLPSSPLIKQPWAAAFNSARLFYNYLRLSPSYAAGLVHRSRSVVKRLNRQGQKVLACVKKYADVYKLDFDAWIKGPGLNRLTAPTLLPEIHTAASIKASDPSDLFVRFPKGKNVLPQLELLAFIANNVPSVSKRKLTTRLTPLVEKNLWRDVYLSYLIKNYPERSEEHTSELQSQR